MMHRTCFMCGKEYQPTSGTQKYCPECIVLNARIRNKTYSKVYRALRSEEQVKRDLETKKVYDASYYLAHSEEVKVRTRIYHCAHPEENKIYSARWVKANPEKVAATTKKWWKDNPGKSNEYNLAWKKEHPEEARIIRRRRNAKRRTLGFTALNSPFLGCEGHHLNKTDVIYEPKKLHRSIYHNQWTGKGMVEANALAGAFLTEDWT
jgi:hypothetical protein